MAKLVLQRIKEYKDVKIQKTSKVEDSTIGTLKLFDDSGKEIWSGFSVENIGPSTDAKGSDKRILPGKYFLEWCVTNKNGGLVKKYPKWRNTDGSQKGIWVKRQGDKSFDDRLIRIHVGNYPQDTEACILPNLKDNLNGTCSGSSDATNQLYLEIEKIGISKVEFEVFEII